jgi:hypothetical protein
MAVTTTTGIAKCMVAIGCEEDLKLSPKFLHINPPPPDGRCDCCGKDLNELKPYSLVGHPCGVDIEEALLVKTFRPSAPPEERVDRVIKEFFGSHLSDEEEKRAEERLIEVYGHELAGYLLLYAGAASQVNASWECSECIALDTEAYFEVHAAWRAQNSHGCCQDSDDCAPINHEEMMQRLSASPGIQKHSDSLAGDSSTTQPQ